MSATINDHFQEAQNHLLSAERLIEENERKKNPVQFELMMINAKLDEIKTALRDLGVV